MAGFTDYDGEAITGCEAKLQKDVNHCGSCGNVCDLSNADSECVGGECVIASCMEGFDNCVSNLSTGCETNLQTNALHCGSCDKVYALLNGNPNCVEGEFEVDNCLDGFASCDDKSSDSCETNLKTDENNCGSCGTICDLFNTNSKR